MVRSTISKVATLKVLNTRIADAKWMLCFKISRLLKCDYKLCIYYNALLYATSKAILLSQHSSLMLTVCNFPVYSQLVHDLRDILIADRVVVLQVADRESRCIAPAR